jgi:hypothetical protein
VSPANPPEVDEAGGEIFPFRVFQISAFHDKFPVPAGQLRDLRRLFICNSEND